jgi:proteasome lid subunit RPN8/RPN11
MIVRLTAGVMETLRAAARAAHPRECCGLLTGQPGLIEAVVPAANVSPHPETSFEIDPAILLQTHRAARGQQRRVLGHYHSHPDGSAQPSIRDAARAIDNGQIWLIIAGDAVKGWQAVANDPGAVHGRFVPIVLAAA